MIGSFKFHPATKTRARARIAIIGPSGSGKTYSALAIAAGLGKRVAVIDTERGSASKYAGLAGMPAFDVLELETFAPETYVAAIGAAGAAGYEVLVIDSLSHAWMGKDGALEQVDRAAKRSQSGNSFAAWRDITPKHNALVDAMLASPCHLIVTMRAKTEYVMETNSRGKQEPRKIGLAPIQRDGMEYEFDVVGDITLDHELIISKTRCPAFDGKVIRLPGAPFGQSVAEWLSDGAPMVQPTPVGNGAGLVTRAVDAENLKRAADLAEAELDRFADEAFPPTSDGATVASPAPAPVDSWGDLVAAATTGREAAALFNRAGREENNHYRRVGAQRLAALRFCELLPESMPIEAVDPTIDKLSTFAATLAGAAVPPNQHYTHDAALSTIDAHVVRLMGMLSADDGDGEVGGS